MGTIHIEFLGLDNFHCTVPSDILVRDQPDEEDDEDEEEDESDDRDDNEDEEADDGYSE